MYHSRVTESEGRASIAQAPAITTVRARQACREGLPHKLHKFNKIRHLTSARTDPVYQPCVPKSILSLRLPTDKSASPDRDALNVRYASDSGGRRRSSEVRVGPTNGHSRSAHASKTKRVPVYERKSFVGITARAIS